MLNLQKDDVFVLNLQKKELENLNIGLGWDTKADLDVHAILRDENGHEIKQIYFGNKKALGVRLSGDNRTGEGDGDDEIIFINRDELSSSVHHISVYVNIYSGISNFGKVDGGYIRLFNENTGEVLARSNLDVSSLKHKRAVHFIDINTSTDDFKFKVIMKGGSSLRELKDKYKLNEISKNSNIVNPSENGQAEEKPKKKKRFFGLF